MEIIELLHYQLPNGKEPFIQWINKLGKSNRIIINSRIARLRRGNFGDCKPIKGSKGIYEMRFHIASGYRVYFAKEGDSVVILLIAGNKGSQTTDIKKAKEYWLDYQGRDDD